MQNGSLTEYLVVFFLSYMIFVFVSGMLNPFVKPKSYMPGKSLWHFARCVALVFILCYCLALIAAELLPLPRAVTFTVSMVGFGVLWVVMSIGRYVRINRVRKRGNTIAQGSRASKRDNKYNFESSHSARLPVANEDTLLVSTQVLTERISSADYIDSKTTAEYELELELATEHIAPDLTDFDQSIVEAVFLSEDSSFELDDDFSSPDFAAEEFTVVVDHFSVQSEIKNLDAILASTDAQEELSEMTEASRVGLSDSGEQMADSVANAELTKQQYLQVELLRDKNQRLEATKESLIIELAKLKVVVKDSEAAARKNEAAKDHALLLKGKALQVAALEKKKRRMTEVKARKVILKLRQNMESLKVENQT